MSGARSRRRPVWQGWMNTVAGSDARVTSSRLDRDQVANRWFPKVRSWIALGAPLELLSPLSIARIVALVGLLVWPLATFVGGPAIAIAGVLLAANIGAVVLLLRADALTPRGCSATVIAAGGSVLLAIAASDGGARIGVTAPVIVLTALFAGLFLRATPLVGGVVGYGLLSVTVTAVTDGGRGVGAAVTVSFLALVVALMTAMSARTSRLAGALDPDTGTPNARGLVRRLLDRDHLVVVGTVHLRGVDQVRSALGHDAGSEVVRRVVEDLGQVLPLDVIIGRGADDDVVLLAAAAQETTEPDVDHLTAELERAVASAVGTGAYMVGDVEVVISAYLGIDVAADPDRHPEPRTVADHVSAGGSRSGGATDATPNVGTPGVDHDTATPAGEHLRRSSLAARRAAESGRRVERWDGRSNQLTAHDLELLSRLRVADERGELAVDYQPQVRSPDGRIVSVESLLRWRPEGLPPVSPGVFIPLAERTGLIDRLTEWVLGESLDAQARWRRRGIDIGVSVNVSPLLLRNLDFGDRVMGHLARTAVPPTSLLLEVTESMAFDVLGAVERLGPLREQGVSVAIDDFGTGFTSLGVLPELGLDEIKIDQSFVRDSLVSPASEAIVRSMCELAHRLGLRAVAEGVEDETIAGLMVALGYDLLQGYHFARPMPEGDLIARLEAQSDGSSTVVPADASTASGAIGDGRRAVSGIGLDPFGPETERLDLARRSTTTKAGPW